ncbi:MAG: EAL domain-containing protein [Oleiphilaceae bacterium]|nr:EAL domain-containing protein [Oleiphilaceae bacterium]
MANGQKSPPPRGKKPLPRRRMLAPGQTPDSPAPPDDQELTRIMLDMQSRFIRFNHQKPAFEGFMMDLLELTGSRYGLIAEILPLTDHRRMLKLHALSSLQWSERLLEVLAEQLPDSRVFQRPAGELGQALCGGSERIYSNHKRLPLPDNFPDELPAVESALFLPVFHEDEQVGVVALFNRPHGFTPDWPRLLEPLLVTLGHMMATRRLKDEREKDLVLMERLSLVARNTTNGVVMTDTEGRTEWVNEGFERITGYSADEYMGKKPGHLLQGSDTNPETVEEIRRALTAGEGFAVDILNYRRDGEPYWVHIHCNPITDSTTGLKGYIAIESDITRRKKAEIALSQFRSTLDQTMDAVMIIDRQSLRFTFVNQGALSQLGYSRDQLMAMDPQSLMTDIPRADSEQVLERLVRGERKSLQFETHLRRQDGSALPVNVSIQYVTLEDGSGQYVAIARDMTERNIARREQAIAASVYESSFDGVMILDQNNRVMDVNPAFSRITGYSPEEVKGKPPMFFSEGLHDAAFYEEMGRELDDKGYWRGEIWSRRKNGEAYPKLLSVSRVYADSFAGAGETGDGEQVQGNTLSHQVVVFSDISELKNHQAELEAAANYDMLTGLPNRRLLADRLDHALARVDRYGGSLAVCLMDMDGFKPINDTYGHELGDQVLMEMARRLSDHVRGDDTVARLGGDEFVLLLNGAASDSLFERLMTEISQPMVFDRVTINPTFSLGVTLYPEDPSDNDMLLRHADQAMYLAKESGKNGYSFFDASHDAKRRKQRKQIARLRQALEQDEFALYYQPQVDLRDGSIIGMEALIRWQHPQKGLLPPASFLSQLEDSELELPVGEWVINTAFDQLELWRDQGRTLPLCINIGANHLLNPHFIEHLRNSLARHSQVMPPMISLEILETTALHDMREAWQVINHCRELGFQVALDDFGTGFSSLTYFRKLPIDMIKIDQSFIREMLINSHDRAIVESVVFLARKFDRPVLAEGVETDEHARALLAMGCHLMQGYGIARPMPAQEVLEWCREWDSSNPYRQKGQN